MFKDYVGETEEDAINTAIEDLHIERADFDVEVLKTVKKGLFKKGSVTIRVYVGEHNDSPKLTEFTDEEPYENIGIEESYVKNTSSNPLPENEIEEKVVNLKIHYGEVLCSTTTSGGENCIKAKNFLINRKP